MKSLDEMLASGQPVVVIYHKKCMDGITAAVVASLALTARGVTATFLPHAYDDPISGLPEGRCTIFMIDVSWERGLLDMVAADHDLVVLDHHKTAQANLEGADYARFDMNKSGAGLAWDYFFPGQEVPALVAYVQDRDIWTWTLPHSEQINAAIASYPLTIDSFTSLFKSMSSHEGMQEMIAGGEAIQRFIKTQVERSMLNVRPSQLDGHNGVIVNSCLLQSEIGHALLELCPTAEFAAIWCEDNRGRWQFSLRSRKGGLDVSAIAKNHGGGGHAAAAGFTVAFTEEGAQAADKKAA